MEAHSECKATTAGTVPRRNSRRAAALAAARLRRAVPRGAGALGRARRARDLGAGGAVSVGGGALSFYNAGGRRGERKAALKTGTPACPAPPARQTGPNSHHMSEVTESYLMGLKKEKEKID